MPGEDAADIIANTFLANITDKQINEVGLGFLQHRERKLSRLLVLLSVQWPFYIQYEWLYLVTLHGPCRTAVATAAMIYGLSNLLSSSQLRSYIQIRKRRFTRCSDYKVKKRQ